MPKRNQSDRSFTAPPAQLLAEAADDTARTWTGEALCAHVDPELFFPPGDQPAAEARQVCAHCPVQGQCLAYSIIADESFGIWGGCGPDERQTMRRQLQRRGELPPPATDRAA